ncbi:hypothetical protein BGW80DRAFT_1340435, partial [Lactifluus volemus]
MLDDCSVISMGGRREIDVGNVEGKGRGVSLATVPENDDDGMSGTTPRLAF